jgi:hypothetical protein
MKKFEFNKSNVIAVKGVNVHIEKKPLADESNIFVVQFFINDELQVQDRSNNESFIELMSDKGMPIDNQISDWGNYMMNITDVCDICKKVAVCPPLYGIDILEFPKYVRSTVCFSCKERLYDWGYFRNGINSDKMHEE